MSFKLSVQQEDWTFKEPFGISGHISYSEPAIVVKLQDGNLVGRGEAEGIYYFDETTASMIEQIKQVTADVEAGASRMDLLDLLPPGGARCAIDSALWDLEAKRAGKRVWELAGLKLKKIVTVFTIGLEEEPAEMVRKAAAAAEQPNLKIKLDANCPVEKIEAIRTARPNASIVIDANEAWSFQQLVEVVPRLHDLGITMIEQPLPRGADAELEGYQSPVPLCADESCVHVGDVAEVAGRYQMINIKLDKSGGLTHGLEIAREARKRGLALMVGNMCGTSLAMAPSFVMGLVCDLHDLDGPLLFEHDRPHAMKYSGGIVSPPCPELWG